MVVPILFALPSIYDLIALSTWPMDEATQKPIETVLQFICDPRFQDIFDGYMWDSKLKRCYSAGRVYLAVFIPQRKIMFLERIAKLKQRRILFGFRKHCRNLKRIGTRVGDMNFHLLSLWKKKAITPTAELIWVWVKIDDKEPGERLNLPSAWKTSNDSYIELDISSFLGFLSAFFLFLT